MLAAFNSSNRFAICCSSRLLCYRYPPNSDEQTNLPLHYLINWRLQPPKQRRVRRTLPRWFIMRLSACVWIAEMVILYMSMTCTSTSWVQIGRASTTPRELVSPGEAQSLRTTLILSKICGGLPSGAGKRQALKFASKPGFRIVGLKSLYNSDTTRTACWFSFSHGSRTSLPES